MSNYLKPQSPLYHKTEDAYFYPLTTVDQIIMDDGTRLNTELDVISSTANTKCKKTTTTATLEVANWSNLSQTIAVSGVTIDNTVIVVAAPASYIAYQEANVRCTAQASNKLTFTCNVKPEVALTANVLILD